jgi:hypothetical protein
MRSTPLLFTAVACALALCLFANGCSETVEPEASPSAPAAPLIPALARSEAAPPVVNTATETPSAATAPTAPPEDIKPQPDANGETTPTLVEDEEAKPTVAEYKPPFPERVDLFVPPKRQGGMRLKEGETEDAVELLGFVDVDRPQVVLSVNGQVVPIAEGATQYGVEVISIQPPKVVLQRGRQRWQASIEN